MPNTMTLISAVTVGAGGAATINFTNIPTTYTDLYVNYSIRHSESATDNWAKLTFNSVGGTSNSTAFFRGNGSTTASSIGGGDAYFRGIISNAGTSTSNVFASNNLYIPNYTSGSYKQAISHGAMENNATYGYTVVAADLWLNSGVISSIQLNAWSGTFNQYSTAYLYGINNS